MTRRSSWSFSTRKYTRSIESRSTTGTQLDIPLNKLRGAAYARARHREIMAQEPHMPVQNLHGFSWSQDIHSVLARCFSTGYDPFLGRRTRRPAVVIQAGTETVNGLPFSENL